MSIYKVTEAKTIKPLVLDWEETMLWSYLQGCMGEAWASGEQKPESAQIVVGDFCFLVGKPDRELVTNRAAYMEKDGIIMVPQSEDWHGLIESSYGERAAKQSRYAIKKDPYVFNKEKLSAIVKNLAPEYSISMVGEVLFHQILELPWARDLCANFSTYQQYRKHGLGVVILKNGEIVSGASSYTYYHGGIEIEIDTREDMRRRGLALTCGAKLIIECLNRGNLSKLGCAEYGVCVISRKAGL
jgi:hypothetical protein